MKKRAIATATAVLLIGGAVSASEVEFEYENFRKTPTGAVEIVLKFTNKTNKRVSVAIADCALLGADKKAITVIPVIVENMQPGQYAYGKNYGPRDADVQHTDCRIRAFDF